MNESFNAIPYFVNFLILSIILLPTFYVVKSPFFRKLLFVATGLYLFYIIAPRLMMFYLIYWTVAWCIFALFDRLREGPPKTLIFVIGVVSLISPMILWKIFPASFNVQFSLSLHHLTWYISEQLGEVDALRSVFFPLGLSFITFRAIDLLVQHNVGLVSRLGLGEVLFYGFYPPALIVGPIIQYEEIKDKGAFGGESISSTDIGLGLQRIVIGLFKIYVVAQPLGFSSDVIYSFEEYSTFFLWKSVFFFALYFYFNFSGYADIAIGCSHLFGVKLKENFNYPYLQRNLQLFWSNWHMSLTRFAQKNVFIPLGGFRKKNQYVAIIATIMTIALWHNISISLFIFGVYHAVGLCVSRYFADKNPKKDENAGGIMSVINTAATFIYVMLSIPMVALEYEKLSEFYLTLFGLWR